MPKKLDPAIAEVLRGYGYGADAVWDCHGTWVVYHRVLEQIAAKANIQFDMPLPLEANGAGKSVAICVCGRMNGKTEWSIGEAAPGNNKNSYPYAMAEKRGKDRVVLKLIGLHGLAYSEDEADDFKPEQPARASSNSEKKKTDARGDTSWDQFQHDLTDCHSAVSLAKLRKEYQEKIYPTWPKAWPATAEQEFDAKLSQFSVGDALADTLAESVEYDQETGEITEPAAARQDATKADYVREWFEAIDASTDAAALKKAWASDAPARRRFSLTQPEVDDLKARLLERVEALAKPQPTLLDAG